MKINKFYKALVASSLGMIPGFVWASDDIVDISWATSVQGIEAALFDPTSAAYEARLIGDAGSVLAGMGGTLPKIAASHDGGFELCSEVGVQGVEAALFDPTSTAYEAMLIGDARSVLAGMGGTLPKIAASHDVQWQYTVTY